MATVVVMPQLGNSVESCIIMSWEVSVGDTVAVDQVLCQIETDKSTMEVPSTAAGTVLALLAEEGDEVPVKDPLIVLGEAGETYDPAALGLSPAAASPAESSPSSQIPADSAPTAAAPAPAAPAPEAPATAAAHGAISPRARAAAAHAGVPLEALEAGSGPKGRVIERDVTAFAAANPALTSAARAAGVSAAAGTGLGGRVTVADGSKPTCCQGAASTTAAATAAANLDFPGAYSETPLKGVRKVVAERMQASLVEAAQLSYTVSANAAGLLALRKRLKNTDPELGLSGVTIGDLVGYAVVKTLKKHPVHNATLEGGVLREYEQVHLAFAADTPRGLLVPVVRHADSLSLKAFSAASKDLAAQAVAGTISPDLLSGGTFTVSNLGSFGVETFTPIINRPQTAILGVAAITPHPVVKEDGSIGVVQKLGLSLTADHQVIDGADAARFLRDLVAAIENIDVTVLA